LSTGKWPNNIQIPKSSDVLTSKGSIDWSQVPDSGYVLDSGGKAIKETYFPKKGEIIDRYGPSDGTFISPVIDGKPYSYDNRSLPYIDDLSKYHQYELTDDLSKLSDYIRNCTDKELVQDINDFMVYKKIKSYDDLISYKGEIAPGFGSIGGGIQYQLRLPLDILEELGFLKTIK
jgi:Tuberculosis necrotizing toxin